MICVAADTTVNIVITVWPCVNITEDNGSAVPVPSLLHSRGRNYTFQVHFTWCYRPRYGIVLNS